MAKEVSHRIERTLNRHSRAVLQENTIVIRLARGLTQTQEREHISWLLKRMMKKVLLEHSKTVIDPFRPLLEGNDTHVITLASGRTYDFSMTNGSRTRAKRSAHGWKVEVGPSARRELLHRLLWNLLARSELPRIEKLVREINESTFNVSIHGFRLAYAATQWGSCSAKGAISLNVSLLFVPPELLRYVIVHELAHRRIRSHSKRYWKEVESVMPAYKKLRLALGNFRICRL